MAPEALNLSYFRLITVTRQQCKTKKDIDTHEKTLSSYLKSDKEKVFMTSISS